MATRLEKIPLWDATAVASGGVLTSDAISCKFGDPEHLMFKVTSALGSAAAKIEFLISDDGTNFNTSTSQPVMDSSTAVTYGSANPEEFHVLTCPSAPWIKIQVTEMGANSDTFVTASLWMRNDVAEIR